MLSCPSSLKKKYLIALSSPSVYIGLSKYRRTSLYVNSPDSDILVTTSGNVFVTATEPSLVSLHFIKYALCGLSTVVVYFLINSSFSAIILAPFSPSDPRYPGTEKHLSTSGDSSRIESQSITSSNRFDAGSFSCSKYSTGYSVSSLISSPSSTSADRSSTFTDPIMRMLSPQTCR